MEGAIARVHGRHYSIDGRNLARVGGLNDHVHLLVTLKPVHTLSDVLRDLKKSSSVWIHREIADTSFAWQEGYGAFTASRSNTHRVKQYIDRQEDHHRERTFQDEYRALLRKYGISFEERYLW